MELKILKHAAGLTETIFHGKVLEKNVSASDLSGIGMLHVYLHNIEESISEEILPQIKKHELGQIINCTSASPYLYFTSVFYQENEAKQGTISVIRYDSVTQNMESVYSFDDDISKYGSDLKLNLWILSDTYLFLQKEYLVRNSRNTYSGFMRFEISLVNLKDGGRYDILDEKIVKNGIADILQFSENQCVIKTGFCLLDELRYQELTEEEASLEAVSIVNIGQMASDLVLVQDQVVLNTLDQAFFTTTIPYIKLTGNYLIYSCVNLEKKQEEIKFYHLETCETKSCIHPDIMLKTDLAEPYVINEEPYICIAKDHEISFLNLNTSKVDVKFELARMGETLKLQKVLKNALVFSRTTKPFLLRKSKTYIDLYRFPGKEILFHETGDYADCIETNDGIIYLIEN